MLPDPKRKKGFYWVRFEGEVQVAEYVGGGLWKFCGCANPYADAEVCELLSRRLTINTLVVK